MKQFTAFIHKEFLHIFRDSRTMLILIVMPLVLICLFGVIITTEVKNTRVIVVDQLQNEQSRAVVQRLQSNAYFHVVGITTDERHQDESIRQDRADLVLLLATNGTTGIPAVQILADGSEPNQAQSRVAYLQNILMQERMENSHISTITTPPVSVRMLFNPQLRSEFNFVPGIIGLIVMLICAMMTSISIVREKEMGTMEILLASPLHPLIVIVAKLIPYFVISSFNLISILLLSKYVFDLPIGTVGMGWTSVVTFCLLSMIYIIVALAIGLLISCAVSTQLAAMLLSLLLIVPALYLSGLAFPIESMPTPLQNASRIVPMRWYVEGARRLLIQGVEMRHVASDLGVLCLEAVVLITLSLKLFKKRLA